MAQATAASSERSVRYRWWGLGGIALAQLMVMLDMTIVNIALPWAQQDTGMSDASRQWVVTAYTLAFGALLLLGGRVGDLAGRLQQRGAPRVDLLGAVGVEQRHQRQRDGLKRRRQTGHLQHMRGADHGRFRFAAPQDDGQGGGRM